MLTVFTDGQVADRDLTNSTLSGIYNQGTAILAGLATAYTVSLASLERRLSAINSRRQRSNWTATLGTLGSLTLTDFVSIDQSNTTATVRIDGGGASLWELTVPQRASIATNVFSSDSGTVNTFSTLYQVLEASSATIPTGTFLITLTAAVDASLILFDIAATPSSPVLSVSVSADGTTYVLATSVNLEGYRISARLAPSSVKYIQLSIQPSHPDDIDGTTFTFGITDVSLSAVQFQLSSELTSRPILINPSSLSFQFVADADPGIQFYLSLNGSSFSQVASGDTVPVPGAVDVSLPGIAVSGSSLGLLLTTLPGGVYPNSLTVTDVASGTVYPLLPGLNPALTGVSLLSGKSVAVFSNSLTLVPESAGDNAKTSNVDYTTGPASISIQVRALFTTTNNSVTPVFRGATFQEN